MSRPMLHFARAHVHQNPIYAGHMYSVGGRLLEGEKSIDGVEILSFE